MGVRGAWVLVPVAVRFARCFDTDLGEVVALQDLEASGRFIGKRRRGVFARAVDITLATHFEQAVSRSRKRWCHEAKAQRKTRNKSPRLHAKTSLAPRYVEELAAAGKSPGQ